VNFQKLQLLYLLLLILIALTVVLMVNTAGVILLIALLTLPAATAKCYARHLSTMMISGTVLAMAEITIGLFAGYSFNLPVGPASVITAVIFYITALLANKLFRHRSKKND
jgi:zinc transport system permease protein